MSIGTILGLVLLVGVQAADGTERHGAAEVEGQGMAERHGPARWTEGLLRHYLPEEAGRGASAGACGLWSVDLTLRLAGREPMPLSELGRRLNIHEGAASVHSVVQTLRANGFRRADAVRVVEASAIADVPLPAIAYLHPAREGGEGHFVVLAAREHGKIQVIDYPRYTAWVPIERLARFDDVWQGELVLLEKPPRAWTPWRAGLFGASCAWLGVGLLMLVRQGVRRFRRNGPAPVLQAV